MPKKLNLNNQIFGKLTVISESSTLRGKSRWKVMCECGKIKEVNGSDLTSKKTTSCGQAPCKKFNTSAANAAKKLHGDSKSRLFNIWVGMRHRCRTHKDYFGRGIKVCPEWKNYLNFKKWAMASGYEDSLTLDRVDNNGNYSAKNCRWASKKVQANNTRKNRTLEYDGKRLNMNQWARLKGLHPATLQYRLNAGWSIERALNEQPS